MKILQLLAFTGLCLAQSITVTAPSSGGISGFAYDFTVSVVSLPTIESVEYYVDQRLTGMVSDDPWTFRWSTHDLWNGNHKVYAVAKDAVGAVLATSAENSFTIENGSDTIAVTPSTAVTSPWSGIITFAIAITRGDAADSACYLYVDGVYHSQQQGSTTCNSLSLDTTVLENGSRRIFIQASDVGNSSDHRGMWEDVVTVSNTSTGQIAVLAGYSELFLIPTGTAQLTPSIVLADSSVIASTSSLPASDTFTRSNETPLVGDWTQSEGSIKLVSNAVTGNSNEANAAYFWNQDTFPNDQYSEVKVPAASGGSFIGVAMRARTGGTYYGCSWDGATVFLFRRNAGVTAGGFPSVSSAWTTNDVLRGEVSGQSPVHVVCKKNGSEVVSYDDSASDRILYGQAGLATFRDTGATTGDDWAGGDLAAGTGPDAIYVSGNVGVVTVSSSGLVTGVATGDTDITVFSRGLIRLVRATVNTVNILPHFGRDGQILTSYSPGNSISLRSWFFAGRSQLSNMATDYKNSGANAWEEGFCFSPSDAEAENDWKTRVDGHFAALATFAGANNLLLVGTGDGLFRLNADLYRASDGVGQTWSPKPVTYCFQKSTDAGYVVSIEGVDEVSAAHGNTPYPVLTVSAGGPFTQIAASSETCTVSYLNVPVNGGALMIVSGSVTTNLNSVSPNLYTITNTSTNSYQFACPGVANGTYNSSNDPTLSIQVFASAWHSGDFVDNAAFTRIMADANAVSSRTKIAWPVPASADALSYQNWSASNIADYGSMFWAASTRRFPWGEGINEMIGDMRTTYRDRYAVTQRDKPWTMITAAAGPMYKIGGVPVSITSIGTDGIITFAADHGVSVITHGTTRVDISGSSALNGDFYAVSIPSSTTMRVAYEVPINTGTGFGGTATFDTAQAFTVTSFQVDTANAVLIVQDPGGCALENQVHHRFTLTGSSVGALNRDWYFATASTTDPCTVAHRAREIPAVSSSGGTGYIISTNTYLAGRNELMVPGVATRNVIAGFFYPFLQGAAGVRNYGLSNVDPDADDVASTSFQSEPVAGDGINYNAGPLYAANGMTERWDAISAGSQVVAANEPLFLQPRSHAPDYGAQVVCTVRSGSSGNLLACLNITEGTLTRTFNLAPFAVGGVASRYRVLHTGASFDTVSATTDSLTIQPGETIIWAFAPYTSLTTGQSISSGSSRSQ